MKSILVDTNIIIAIFLDQYSSLDKEVAKKIELFLDGKVDWVLDPMVLFECVYTMKNKLNLTKDVVCSRLKSFISKENLEIGIGEKQDKGFWRDVLDTYTNNSLDFVDAYLLARARNSEEIELLSFDKKLISFE